MKIEKIELSSQKVWSKEECIEVFIKTFFKLYNFLNINKADKNFLLFDKDDDDCMNFITAASNLRMINFSIEQKSKFDIQSIAGNIIPAIASTNAVVAAFQVIELIHIIEYFEILKEKEKNSFRESKVRHVWVKSIVGGNNMFVRGNLINSEKLELPNPHCYICQQTTMNVHIKNFDEMTLYTFVKDVCTNELGCLYPFLDTEERNVFDYDFFAEGNENYIKTLYKSLSSWGIKDGTILILTDIQNSEEQLEIHLKEDSSLETMYAIKHKDIKKKMKKKNDQQENDKMYLYEKENKNNGVTTNSQKNKYNEKNGEIKLIVIDDDDDKTKK